MSINQWWSLTNWFEGTKIIRHIHILKIQINIIM